MFRQLQELLRMAAHLGKVLKDQEKLLDKMIEKFEKFNLTESEAKVDELTQKMETLIMAARTFGELVTDLKKATDDIATVIQTARDTLANAGATAAEEAAAISSIDEQIARLQAMGTSTTDPIPPV